MAKLKLWDQLNDAYPKVLPTDVSKAINGTRLLEMIKPRLEGEYTDNAIRAYFSYMSQDPSSRIAKKSDGHGYYLRPTEIPKEVQKEVQLGGPIGAKKTSSRDEQPEEKFRALFMRYSETFNNQFPVCIDHTRAEKKEAGLNLWKFPDVVLLEWGVGKPTEEGFKLDQNLLTVKKSLGEPPFTLNSVELKASLSLATFRENFFQCLSNSKWAHRSTLAVADTINDKTLLDELQRLGASYDVSITSFGLSPESLSDLPKASEIRKMSDETFENEIAPKLSITRISAGRERGALDWEAVKDLQSLSPDFREVFEWIAYCLNETGAFRFEDFKQIRNIRKKA